MGTNYNLGFWGKVSGGVKCQAQVFSPLDCAIASKLIRHGTGRGDKKTLMSLMWAEVTPSPDTEEDQTFKLNGELLHGGKGKDNTLVNIACNHDTMGDPAREPHTSGWEGL